MKAQSSPVFTLTQGENRHIEYPDRAQQVPPGDLLQPEATGAIMEETKWLKPSGKACHELVTARVCRPQRE
jgi:hypothetical protein